MTNMQLEFFLRKLEEDLQKLVEDYPKLKTGDTAFGPWSIMLLTDIPVNEALESVVEGGGDKGIDAICVPSDPGTLVILQAKHYKRMDKNFEKNEIVLTLNGVRWLLNGDLDDPTVNPAFRATAKAFREAFTTYFPKVEIYLVCTGQGPAADGQSEIDMFLREANTAEPVFSVLAIDVNELFGRYKRALQETTPNEIVLEFSNPRSYEHDIGGMRALVGTVAGRTLAELFDKYGNAIFEANIRNYLGNVTINQQIEKTATDSQQARRFWFYNNGITLICTDYAFRSQMETSKVRLTNAQIVNGCQTVHSLWHALKSGELQDEVEVQVRIVEQPDPEFGRLVTRYNNSQNAVRSTDQMGRDLIQIQLQQDMDRLGYYYETRRGDWKQYYADRDMRVARYGKNYNERIIRLKEAAQACAAFYMQQPVTAKSKTALLTAPVQGGGLYEEVFDANSSAQRIVGAVELMRRFTKKRNEILETGKPASLAKYADWLPHADFCILALFGRQHFEAAKIRTNDQTASFFREVNRQFEGHYSSIVTKMGAFIDKRQKERGYNHPKFFKSEAGWQEIKAAMGRPDPTEI